VTAMPLAHLRVLEVGTGTALAYCGKMFADFGAAVVKLEAPDGDPARHASPLVNGESAFFTWLNAGKRCVRDGAGVAARVLAGCDVLLDARPKALRDAEPLGLDRPDLVAAALSWFGDSGPYRDFAATDTVIRALAGTYAATGEPAGPPLMHGGCGGEVLAGVSAFTAVAAGLFGRAEAGGRRLEVSIHAANVTVSEYQAAHAVAFPEADQRCGINRFASSSPMGVYPCREGWLGVTVVTPAQWRSFCDMLGLATVGSDPRFVVAPARLEHADAIEALFRPRLLTRTAAEWFAEALERRLPFAVVPDMAGLLAQDVFRARGAFAELQVGGAIVQGPALPQHLTRTPPRRSGRTPALGEADAWPARAPAVVGHDPSRAPLAGVRVVDFSMGWAGPLCTRQLGDLGADVIKVEACQYPDWWRGVDPRDSFFAERRYEESMRFAVMNRNKRGITLDLTAPEGVALLKRLVRGADAVVENYSSGVLPKLGLDYAALSAVKPDLVMVSMSAFGAAGPWSDARAYGSTLEHAAGLPSMTGPDGGPPVTNQLAYGDPIGGINGAGAVLAALLHRQATGQGQHVDLSLVQCIFPFVAPWMLEQSATGRVAPRLGNRHPEHVPHGCFPCRGDNAWITVAVTDDTAWQGLCGAIGRVDLAGRADLATTAGRRANEDAIEAALTDWTRGRDADAAMQALQAAGVAAGVVRLPASLPQDPHLTARRFWQDTDRRYLGRHPQPSAPFRPQGGGPYPVIRAAPTLGEHNAEVIGDLLGVDAAAMARLAADGVTGQDAVPVSRRKETVR